MKKEDNTYQNYQLDVNEKFCVRYSYKKYFWKFLFSGFLLFKLIQFYLISHPQYYRVFHLLTMDDIPKKGPMFLKTFLNTKIPSEYLTSYPLLFLIALISGFMIWWVLIILTSDISINYKKIELSTGIFNKSIGRIDLVKVTDAEIKSPWYDRILGLGNIHIQSRDPSTPYLILSGLSTSDAKHFYNYIDENSYVNMTDLARARMVERREKNKKSNVNVIDDGEGYND